MNKLPKISYHGGHSGELCDHAADTKELIIQAYINAGFSHIGLTEHLAPDEDRFLYPGELDSGHDAEFQTKRFARYFETAVPSLKERFSEEIDLRLGFETEYYGSAPAERLERAVREYRPELIVASIHHVSDIPIDVDDNHYQQAINFAGSLNRLYELYYDQQLALIDAVSQFTSVCPVVLGHLDLIKLFSPEHQASPSVKERVKRNIVETVSSGLVIELNARAFKKGLKEPYPSLEIIEQVLAANGRFTIGDDSHAAKEVGLNYDRLCSAIEGMVEEVYFVETTSEGYQWVAAKL